jgi:hypothetical protein
MLGMTPLDARDLAFPRRTGVRQLPGADATSGGEQHAHCSAADAGERRL